MHYINISAGMENGSRPGERDSRGWAGLGWAALGFPKSKLHRNISPG